MKNTIFISVISILLFVSCKNEKSSYKENGLEEQSHWSYTGETSPEHWIEIEKNSDCGGKRQSPINIIDINTIATNTVDKLKFNYSPETILHQVENNGHSIQFDFNPGDSINYKNNVYHLKQIHFHEPSEHNINGVKYPLEIHLVHQSATKKLCVISILCIEGKESQLFEFFESFLPIKNGEHKDIDQVVNLADLFPSDKSFYSYSGSLTTPPCTEGVNWIVYKEPIVVSLEEVLKLKEIMPINIYRNEQPINSREIYYNY